ncbi:MAG: hypothetical protein JW807_14550 [Spirochaetes bacterium]|nr:hypothetical protein [Spirochaetota bacterium]
MLKKQKTSNIVLDAAQQKWKKRPSEIRGYQRAYYINSEEGDYLRVDYNMKDKRVRLYMELEDEGGNAYYAVITNGKITAERSVATDRNFGFAEKFKARAEIFSTLPNREVLKLVNRNYGILRGREAPPEKKKIQKTGKEKLLEETKRRYFKREFYHGERAGEEGGRARLKRIVLFDLVDVLIGALISGSVFIYFKYSYMAMGVTAAFFGIIIGFVDMFFRGRPPVFMKVFLFLLAGAVSYIYGYLF